MNSCFCAICQEHDDESTMTALEPCGHLFHSKCIVRHLRTGKSQCPLCRDDSLRTADEDSIPAHHVFFSCPFCQRISTGPPDRRVACPYPGCGFNIITPADNREATVSSYQPIEEERRKVRYKEMRERAAIAKKSKETKKLQTAYRNAKKSYEKSIKEYIRDKAALQRKHALSLKRHKATTLCESYMQDCVTKRKGEKRNRAFVYHVNYAHDFPFGSYNT